MTTDADLARELRLAVAQFRDAQISMSSIDRLLDHVEGVAHDLELLAVPTPEPQSIRAAAVTDPTPVGGLDTWDF